MSRLIDRMIRAAKLDAQLYEEVEADTQALSQAMVVVVLSSLAGGIALLEKAGFVGLMMGMISSLAGWYIWAFLTYVIGTKVLPEPQTSASQGELLRTIGFSSSPGLIRVFALLPGLSFIVHFIASLWMLVAMVVAVRQALDYQSTLRAIGVCLIGWMVQILIIAGLLLLVGGLPEPKPAL